MSQYCATDKYPCTFDPLVTYPSCSSSHFLSPFYYKNWEEVAKTPKAAQTPQKSPIRKPTPLRYNAFYSLRLFTNKWRQIGCLIIYYNAANLYSARHYVKMGTLFALTCAISLSRMYENRLWQLAGGKIIISLTVAQNDNESLTQILHDTI